MGVAAPDTGQLNLLLRFLAESGLGILASDVWRWQRLRPALEHRLSLPLHNGVRSRRPGMRSLECELL